MANSADPDQKPTDLDLHCLQNRIYPVSAGQGIIDKKRTWIGLFDPCPKSLGSKTIALWCCTALEHEDRKYTAYLEDIEYNRQKSVQRFDGDLLAPIPGHTGIGDKNH